MKKDTTVAKAEFNPRLKAYMSIYLLLTMVITIILIPLLPIGLILLPIYANKYYNRLHCVLNERTLTFQKGYIFHVEKTIPLDKIQDLTFKEGPLLRFFGLSMLKVETAGGSYTETSDLSLLGIVDPVAFKEKVLNQRDIVTDMKGRNNSSEENDSYAVLVDIKNKLADIENHLSKKHSAN